MLRHLRSNLIAYVALFLALGGGSFAVAALNRHDKRVIKKIVNKQINRRASGLSVNHANSANSANAATHADSADHATSANSAATAQSAISANSADSVGGVSIAPVRIAVPEGTTGTDVVSVNGSVVRVSACTASGNVGLLVARSATGPPLSAEWILPAAAAANFIGPNGSLAHNFPVQGLSATIRQSNGSVTRVSIDAFYAQNAFGGTNDCFVQGTIERFARASQVG